MVDAALLDQLAETGRVAPDWVDGLRRVDADIDAKIDNCLAKVAAAGSFLPEEPAPNAVIWRAFQVPLSKVRVLILGQDPYPDPAHAMGLSFSTGPNGGIPASLTNIYEELKAADYPIPGSGDLSAWAGEGVMLLNRALTLPRDERARPRRHIRWWSPVAVATMKAIRAEANDRPIAALLWGVPAQSMRKYLEPQVKVFASSHPSPRSLTKTAGGEPAFRGSNPFAHVNSWLQHSGAKPVDWMIVD